MRRCLLSLALFALAGSAEALTIRDVIELTRAGVGDDVLLALIEVDRGVYAIDTETLKRLKAAGVSERVMVALVRSGREILAEQMPAANPEPATAPAPQVVVIDHRDDTERVRGRCPLAVRGIHPVRAVRRAIAHRSVRAQDLSTFLPFQTGPPPRRLEPQQTEPFYWGFAGSSGPDAWQPTPTHKDSVKRPDRKN